MKPRVVLVIRGDDGFSQMLRRSGFEVLNLELIRTEPVGDLSELAETIARIGKYDGIFITSPVAAEIFVRQLNGDGLTFSGKVYVLGERAKAIVTQSGLDVVAGDKANTAKDLIRSFEKDEFVGKRLLFVRGDRSIGTIPKMLQGIAKVDELIVYRTNEYDPGEAAIANIRKTLISGVIEQICFFSPSGVESFERLFAAEHFGQMKVAAIGRTTARKAMEAGFDVDFVSERAIAEGFAAGLAVHLRKIE